MNSSNNDNPKQRIFNTAVSLFARKGFAGVGVREIAQKADVNVSMISYYFNGKVGILKAIIEEFYNRYFQALVYAFKDNLPPEENCRLIVRSLVGFVRNNTDLANVAFNSLPLEIPEIAELKVEKVGALVKGANRLLRNFDLDPEDRFQVITIGPSILSIILSHFRFRPIQAQLFGFEYNDEFYESYVDFLSTFLLNGITGLSELNRKQKGTENESDD